MRHARQLDVADIEPPPLHQPVEVRPRHRLADIGVRTVQRRKRFRIFRMLMSWQASGARPRCGLDGVDDGLVAGAAAIIAGKMFADLFSIRHGDCFSRSCAAISIPGVQKPHCSALRSRNADCKSAISPLSEIPSIVSTVALCVCTASSRQERTISPLTRTVHAPHTPCSQPTCVPVSLRCSRRKSAKFRRGSTFASTRSPLTTSEIATAAVTPMPPAEIGAIKQRGYATRQQDFRQMPAHGGCRLLILQRVELFIQCAETPRTTPQT